MLGSPPWVDLRRGQISSHIGGKSRFAYLPEWWVQGLVNGIERHLARRKGQGIKFTDGLALLFFKWRETKAAAMARRSARCKVPSFEELSCPRMSKVANSASTLDQRGGGEYMRYGSKSLSHSVCHLLFRPP
jgi:hypothetical protein